MRDIRVSHRNPSSEKRKEVVAKKFLSEVIKVEYFHVPVISMTQPS